MFDLFLLKDWKGDLHLMRSSKIHKRVMKDSSNCHFNWITSATELINVCNKKKFPEEKAIDIKVAILNCFSDFPYMSTITLPSVASDIDSVYFAYNSLYGIEEEKVINARAKFLNSILFTAEQSTCLDVFHFGKNYIKAKEDWKKEKFDELFNQEKVEFEGLLKALEKDFANRIRKLSKEGAFDKEEEKENSIRRNYITRSVEDFCLEHEADIENVKKMIKKMENNGN